MAEREDPFTRPHERRRVQSQLSGRLVVEVLRIVAEGNTAVSEVRVPHPTVGPYYAL